VFAKEEGGIRLAQAAHKEGRMPDRDHAQDPNALDREDEDIEGSAEDLDDFDDDDEEDEEEEDEEAGADTREYDPSGSSSSTRDTERGDDRSASIDRPSER
jgi:hypothetical protein